MFSPFGGERGLVYYCLLENCGATDFTAVLAISRQTYSALVINGTISSVTAVLTVTRGYSDDGTLCGLDPQSRPLKVLEGGL